MSVLPELRMGVENRSFAFTSRDGAPIQLQLTGDRHLLQELEAIIAIGTAARDATLNRADAMDRLMEMLGCNPFRTVQIKAKFRADEEEAA